MKKWIILCLGVGLFAGSYSTKSDWLMGIEDTNQKFEAIQKQLRGFDVAMVEVGYRYEETQKAVAADNYPLALYHWEKIKVAIENGYTRRPARKEASETIFLNTVWVDVKKAFESQKKEEATQGLKHATISCNACHESQKVGFIKVK